MRISLHDTLNEASSHTAIVQGVRRTPTGAFTRASCRSWEKQPSMAGDFDARLSLGTIGFAQHERGAQPARSSVRD